MRDTGSEASRAWREALDRFDEEMQDATRPDVDAFRKNEVDREMQYLGIGINAEVDVMHALGWYNVKGAYGVHRPAADPQAVIPDWPGDIAMTGMNTAGRQDGFWVRMEQDGGVAIRVIGAPSVGTARTFPWSERQPRQRVTREQLRARRSE